MVEQSAVGNRAAHSVGRVQRDLAGVPVLLLAASVLLFFGGGNREGCVQDCWLCVAKVWQVYVVCMCKVRESV